MKVLPILLLIAATNAAPSRLAVVDTVHSRLSGIVRTTIVDELRKKTFDVREPKDDVDYIVEIISTSDASGTGRTSQIDRSTTERVEVSQVTGGAAAEVHLIRASTHEIAATYKLTGSGDGAMSPAVGASSFDVLNQFIVGPLFRRSRSAEAARAIGHDIASQIAVAITEPVPDTPQR